MVCALGARELLVGRSHECDYPAEIRLLPACTRPLIDVNADSKAIDEQVRKSARNALSIYEVFDDVLDRLQPTHILTQTQCDVCAVSLRDVEMSVASRLRSAPKIVALNPASLADIWEDFRRVGLAVGVDAEPLILELQRRMDALRGDSGLKVACIEWMEPLMAAGNWTPELIAMAGGVDVFGAAGVHSPWITWEQVAERDPDVIIVAPCGFDLARTRGELHWITDRPRLRGEVYLADGNQFFNRPGPRVVETMGMIAEILRGGPSGNPDRWLRLRDL
jgi:iron complex transport system substrate-binding protein